MPNTARQIAAGEFKAKCLEIMSEVARSHVAVVITKRGVPIAQLTPIESEPIKPVNLFGCLRNSVKIKGDILSPIDVRWEANE